MILSIKSALDGIKPDEKLISDTEQMLRSASNIKARVSAGNKKTILRLSGLGMAACIAIAAGTVSVAGYTVYRTPVSYVSIDINPSLELGVNRFDRVVQVRYYNGDAETLVGEKELCGKRPHEAVGLIYAAADDSGYISADGTTVVSIVASARDASSSDRLLEECHSAIKEKHAAVYSDTASRELKKESESLDISPGKLKMIKMIQKLDGTATVDEYKDSSITAIADDLSYFTSAEYTGASEEEKKTVQSEMKNFRPRMPGQVKTDTESENNAAANENGAEKSEAVQEKNGKQNQEPRAGAFSVPENSETPSASARNTEPENSKALPEEMPEAAVTERGREHGSGTVKQEKEEGNSEKRETDKNETQSEPRGDKNGNSQGGSSPSAPGQGESRNRGQENRNPY